MFCRPPRPAAVVAARPDQLVNMVVARPWSIVDLEPRRAAKAPYAIGLECPLLVLDYAEDKNVALLCDSEPYAEAVAVIMIAQGFDHHVALTNRTEWLEYWDDVDAGTV
jgi:hypothetical protein